MRAAEGLMSEAVPPKACSLPVVEAVTAEVGLVETMHRPAMGWPILDSAKVADPEALASAGASDCDSMVERSEEPREKKHKDELRMRSSGCMPCF